jgi:hypothetical protein
VTGGAVRILLAALLAAALLGASLPAAETVRVEHTDAAVDREADRLDRAALALTRSAEPTRAGDARRTVTLRFPARSWGHAGVAALELADGRLRWRLPGGRWRERSLAAPVAVPEPVVARESGRRLRLRLALVETESGRVAVLVFKSDAGTSRAREPRSEPARPSAERRGAGV